MRSVCDLETLRALFTTREARMLRSLHVAMAGAGRSPPEVFDAWMHRESDTVQAATQAFGEREVLEAGIRALTTLSPSLRALLGPLLQLYALTRLEADLAWFLCEGLVRPEVGAAVPQRARQLCADLAPHWRTLVDGFGIPEYLVAAPIAADWTEYNKVDNRGEVLGVKF